jgi:hypothetical protein
MNVTRGAGVALLAGLTACGGMGHKAKSAKDRVSRQLDLVGTWDAGCGASNLVASSYAKLSYELGADSGFAYKERLFTDSACTKPEMTVTARGTYVVLEVKPGGSPLDMTVKELVATPDTEAKAADLNKNVVCGVTSWQSGVEQSIVGTDCHFVNVPAGTTFREAYDVRDGKLYLSAPDALKGPVDPAKRNLSVDLSVPFAKE